MTYQCFFTSKMLTNFFLVFFALSLIACGSSTTAPEPEVVATTQEQDCQTKDDENEDDNCGTLLVGLTDAEGDFVNYTVNVIGLELTRSDGVQVSVLSDSQSVNFADYIELSELATAATIPAGIYVAGSITIDYATADIQVEKDGSAVPANMIDSDGQALTTETLQLQLDENNRLVIARRRPAMLEIDFNLSASHTVDLTTTPVTVTTEPFIVAEVDPIIKKEFRVRGPLIQVDQENFFFRISVRPFHRISGKFGGINIHTTEQTNFEINGNSYLGNEGLAQMSNLPAASPTITLGSFDRATDQLTALTVIAGSGVPGTDKDGVTGVIVARQGNALTVKGASIIRRSGEVTFDDEIIVMVADTTKVSKNRRLQDEVTIADLSIGQPVTMLGDINEQNQQVTLDASDGAVRMRIGHASGHLISEDGLTLNVNLQALQGRTPSIYDFTGTGIDPTSDAQADNYQIATDNLIISNLENNDPVRITGFINAYASAPADFNAISVINYAESRSQLFVNWPAGESVIAFSDIASDSLTVDSSSQGEGGVYQLIQGGIRTEITSFDSSVVVAPFSDRGFYTIKTTDGIISFSNFADFSSVLQQKLDEGNNVDLMHAVGGFANDSKILSAVKIAIKLNQ
jgi:hypothetical protein